MTDQKLSIYTSGLHKIFDNTVAVDDVELTVVEGSITALLGGNGAGKSTTLGMLLGLLQPSSGNIEILGYNLETERRRIAALINFSSPYVDLPQRLTVRENLTIY